MVRTYLIRIALLSLLWWLLTAGDVASWILAGPMVLAIAGWRMGESRCTASRLRLWRLAFFVPFFVWHSLLGSCDVARRALHWRLPVSRKGYP